MKFKLEIEDGKKTIVLVPENAGEQALLAALHPHQDTSSHDIYVPGQDRYFPIIFGEIETHKVVADAIRRRMPGEPVSAGFCGVKKLGLEAWGESESLNLKAHPDDGRLLRSGGGFGPERNGKDPKR